jgi:hypothetical protein
MFIVSRIQFYDHVPVIFLTFNTKNAISPRHQAIYLCLLFHMTMKVLTNIFCLLLVALTLAILADVVHAKSNDVVTLDATNFNAVCSKHKRILALFTDSSKLNKFGICQLTLLA